MSLSCPNCGYGFTGLQRSTRMFDCPSCDTTLFRAEDALEPMGKNGEMHSAPMLIGLGDQVRVGDHVYAVIGHIRFDYGRGWWDEMWSIDGNGDGAWISVDEGDVVLQMPLRERDWPRWQDPPPLYATFATLGRDFTVTEADEGTCVAFRGELPERIEVGEKHQFINATAAYGALISGEFWPGGRAWYAGEWIDPFALEVRRA